MDIVWCSVSEIGNGLVSQLTVVFGGLLNCASWCLHVCHITTGLQANEERADLREQLDEVAATLMGRLRGQLQEREAQLAAACEANSSANQRVQHYLAVRADGVGVLCGELNTCGESREIYLGNM